jgi:putative endonuclease
MKVGYVYIMTNFTNTTLYVWVTSNVARRMLQHKEGSYDWFSKKYKVTKLVRYTECGPIEEAIKYEKVIKWWSRQKKIDMINGDNPAWNDLS